jgi:hypothetical protein
MHGHINVKIWSVCCTEGSAKSLNKSNNIFFRLLSRGHGTTEAYLLFTLADAIFTGIVTGSELNIVVHLI